MERLEHLRIAAEHLAHAGLHEMAEQVRNHAREFEREIHRPGPPDELHRMMGEMREQMEGLRREINALREQVNRYSIHPAEVPGR
jgi:uncharacterized coiled-coil DUF342 family protein